MDRQGLACMARWTGATRKPACFWLVWSSRDRQGEKSTRTRKHELGCNSWRFDLNPTAVRRFFKKPFKDGVRKRWMEWMANGIHEFTATGRQKKPSEELICSWIADAWREIPDSLHFSNAEYQTVLMDQKIILFTKPTMNLSMMTLLWEKCLCLTPSQSQSLKDSMFNSFFECAVEHWTLAELWVRSHWSYVI